MGDAARLQLEGDGFRLRTATEEDVTPLTRIFSTPEVSRWWPGQDAAAITHTVTSDPDIVALVVEVRGEVVGFLQIWEETDPEYRHAGIDLALHPRHQGRGLGPEAIRLACRWVFARGHHRVTIDPAAENHHARRAYVKVGFREVGRMRSYQWDPTVQDWVDGVLYDLLSGELT